MKFDIKKIAQLANLTLDQKEAEKITGQLEEVLKYIDILKEIDTKNVPPTTQVTSLENVYREDDKTQPSLSNQEATRNSHSKHNGLFKTKAILEQ